MPGDVASPVEQQQLSPSKVNVREVADDSIHIKALPSTHDGVVDM